MANYISVKNVVCKFELGRAIACMPVAQALGARWDPRVFPALVLLCANTGCVVSIFPTGSVVIVGCSSPDLGITTAQLTVALLWRKCRLSARVFNFDVCNIVCAVRLPWRLNLDLLYAEAQRSELTDQRKGGASYEPEVFPGMAWPVRVAQSDGAQAITAAFALFPSGNGVVTGLRSLAYIPALNEVLAELDRYELGHEFRGLQPHEVQNRRKAAAPSQSSVTHKLQAAEHNEQQLADAILKLLC